MKIYLTEEGKQELESKIVEIEEIYFKFKGNDDADEHYFDGARTYLKEILYSATILPVEESWENVECYYPDNESQMKHTLKFKNGVIIQSKN